MNAMRKESLLKEYSEVNNSFRLLTDIRFKLLAFLPIASAAAAAFKGESLGIGGFGVSLFGLVVTLGLATYNTRNDQLYGELVSRAAQIERSLGIPDGAFSNRPRPWLTLKICGMSWDIDHGTGVSTIYASSVALWAYGVLAPIIEYSRRGYLLLGLPHFTVTDPAIMVNVSAFILAIIITLLGINAIGKQKKSRARELRKWASKAVNTAVGLTIGEVTENQDLLLLCANLSGEKLEVITARAQFYSKVDTESLGYYIPSGSQEAIAAHIVALLTDLPANWLYDCGTNRRGKV